ncbi:MAG: NAD-dependent epimerase/dehydratase family protein [Gammaproteobacteria bacterium]
MAEGVVVVAGAGGFIGGHLTASLLRQSRVRVRAVDVKPQVEWFQVHPNAQNLTLDLCLREHCFKAVEGATEVYNLAADMGGMGFIENNKALCMLSVLINTHLLLAAKELGVERFFYASSACVYAASKQNHTRLEDGLRETDAYPAMPEDGYGWEKLFSERMCRHFQEDFGVAARIARYHNVYGPHGTWDGGREKAPAAICRKVIRAKQAGLHEIEIWGDGEQTRSFIYIDDCVKGTELLMRSGISEPLNVGSEQMVTINQLVDIVENLAGIKLQRNYNLAAPKGVRGRNSNNELIRKLLDWAPNTRLEAGMEKTYRWIHDEILSGKQSKVGG